MNKDSFTEESLLEVLHVRCFPLPEKRGEVFCFENNIVVLDVLVDTTINLSVFRRHEMVSGDHERSPQSCEGGQSNPPQMSLLNPLRDFDDGML